MSLPSLESQQFKIEILTEHYLLAGTLEVFGLLSTYLNQAERANFQIKQASLSALDTDSTLSVMPMEEVWVRREEIAALRIVEGDTQGLVQRLPIAETLRMFIPRFVIQATMLRGTDTSMGVFFEALAGPWAAATEAQVYPLTALKATVFREAPLLLINKRHIRFYEVVKETGPTPP